MWPTYRQELGQSRVQRAAVSRTHRPDSVATYPVHCTRGGIGVGLAETRKKFKMLAVMTDRGSNVLYRVECIH